MISNHYPGLTEEPFTFLSTGCAVHSLYISFISRCNYWAEICCDVGGHTIAVFFLYLSIWVRRKKSRKTERRLNRALDDSYATEREREVERRREEAHDPCDTKADISSLITLRNDCNESEWVRETEKCKGNERELSEREREKKERSESELIKMSAELWKEKGEMEFHLARRDEVGWMTPGLSRCHAFTKTIYSTGEDA